MKPATRKSPLAARMSCCCRISELIPLIIQLAKDKKLAQCHPSNTPACA